jgi:hypothetical protein
MSQMQAFWKVTNHALATLYADHSENQRCAHSLPPLPKPCAVSLSKMPGASGQRGGGGRRRINLDKADALAVALHDALLVVDEALERLTRPDPKAAQLVQLHRFAGLTVEQADEALELSSEGP